MRSQTGRGIFTIGRRQSEYGERRNDYRRRRLRYGGRRNESVGPRLPLSRRQPSILAGTRDLTMVSPGMVAAQQRTVAANPDTGTGATHMSVERLNTAVVCSDMTVEISAQGAVVPI